MATKKAEASMFFDPRFGGSKNIFDDSRYLNFNMKAKFPSSGEVDHPKVSAPENDLFGIYENRTYTDDHEIRSRKCLMEWNKSDKMEIDASRERYDPPQKPSSPTKSNSSTLSLHIAAYENSMDTVDGGDKNEKIDSTKSSKASNGVPQDPFNFPRQQQQPQQCTEEELMAFKQSQRLLIPYERPKIQFPDPDDIDDDDDEDDGYEDIKAKTVASKIVVIPDKELSTAEIKRKLMNEMEAIEEEKKEAVKRLEEIDQKFCDAAASQRRVKRKIEDKILGGRAIDVKFLEDLEYNQKRILTVLSDRSDAFERYDELKEKEYRIRRKIRELDDY